MNSPEIKIPNDLSAMPQTEPDSGTHENLPMGYCKVSAMNLLVDVFTTPFIRNHMDEDESICAYVRPLFPEDMSHHEMHIRIREYIIKYKELSQRYGQYGNQSEGPIAEQMKAEWDNTLLPILEGK